MSIELIFGLILAVVAFGFIGWKIFLKKDDITDKLKDVPDNVSKGATNSYESAKENAQENVDKTLKNR